MLRAELWVRTFSSSSHQSNSFVIPGSSRSRRFSSQFLSLRIRLPPRSRHHHHHHHHRHHHHPKPLNYPLVSCKKHSDAHGRFHPNQRDPDDDFLEASLLLSETLRHHHLRKQGFHEAKQSSAPFAPFSAQVKDFRAGINTIGLGILRRFQHPTIFLKISCEGDFLLPIVVGEFAVENLIDSSDEDVHGDYSNHFLFLRNIVLDLGYEVKMVKITDRVVNTYFARIYFGKTGERATFSVDARPSDAINVAKRCKAPIYVNKQIVLTDAIRIAYRTGRIHDTRAIYDVLLDSPMEGPDLLGEELRLVQKMKLAVKEERYNDAAMWRDKLVKLRNSGL